LSKDNFESFYDEYVNAVKNTHSLNLDMTYRCPLQCPLCMRERPGGRAKIKKSYDMPIESFEKVCEYFNKIHICGQISDSIYHPKFLDMLKHYHDKYNFPLIISTNGSNKKIEWWEKAYEYSTDNVTWIFGVDGFDQETAEKYRVNIKFDSALDAMKLGASLGKNIVWQFIVFKHNEHQVETVKQFALDNGISFHLMKSSRFHPEIIKGTNIEPPSDEYRNFKYRKRVEYNV
jgi:MoaA/NifB/PqqE/SkfB family radical SAM enzyme